MHHSGTRSNADWKGLARARHHRLLLRQAKVKLDGGLHSYRVVAHLLVVAPMHFSLDEAEQRLTYDRDREVLKALIPG